MITQRGDVYTSAKIEVPLRAGDVLMFHSLLVHGSGENQSPNPRHTALYAYFPPSVKYVPGEKEPHEMTFPVISGLGGALEVTLTKEKVGDG